MSGQALDRLEGVREDSGGFDLLAPDGTRYRVDVTDGVFDPRNPLLAGYVAGRRVVAFVGPTVDRLYGDRLRAYLDARLEPGSWSVHTIDSGERNKTLTSVERVCAVAKASGLDRHGVMLAVGGGIVADVVGFAASMYARGIRYIKVNTTLVGQVDVGVGVKTGVNALDSKNMFGAYHPAHASLNDPALLATLPVREIRCGLAEIVKMAVILDSDLFRALEEHPDAFLRSSDGALETYVLRTSMRLMMEELCPNLREHDLARLVDFGHTFSPVIETAGGHRLEHGEAVAVDMALSAHVARLLGLVDAESCARVVTLLRRIGLPVFDPATCTPELMTQALHASWQRRGRKLHLVVPTGIGKADFVERLEDLPADVLRAALEALARDGGTE
ncbi:sedoheptulose 7-phosphate cyclase [Streptomyces griseomycini]|uniref:2-epi-5-epi-valiolone synthase n=1 Tax=Streptomyces griseomycini TaxID=66895 RepID=A0A7W7PVE9_9ACTN|nr:sedoheptulose 7-phosphate cyclase [Streptomyces griseomycini]MBB4902012.1 3-dehydroquinate synthase [Streptomyces griseomycini]GGQ18216.1 3-dehydroquinate synthase [Streptomyces griseomycini]GGR59648.1 3-dehydroquinate synthase [Streptomyces griseomycini]